MPEKPDTIFQKLADEIQSWQAPPELKSLLEKGLKELFAALMKALLDILRREVEAKPKDDV